MSESLPPPSCVAPQVPFLAPRRTPPPGAGAFRPGTQPSGTRQTAPIPKASSRVFPVLKLLCLIGILGFSFMQYRNYREALQNSLKIENASSVAIDDGSGTNLYVVRFHHQGNPGVLLWKAGPGVEMVAGPGNSLQSLAGHKLRYGSLTKLNYVSNDYSVTSLPDDAVSPSASPHAYNLPEITSLLPVIR